MTTACQDVAVVTAVGSRPQSCLDLAIAEPSSTTRAPIAELAPGVSAHIDPFLMVSDIWSITP